MAFAQDIPTMEVRVIRGMQQNNVVSQIFRVPEILEKILSYEDKHKRTRFIQLYEYSWREYPYWVSVTRGLHTTLPSKLSSTCREMYSKIRHWINPSGLSMQTKVELLQLFETDTPRVDVADKIESMDMDSCSGSEDLFDH